MALQDFPVLDVHMNNIAAVWPSVKLGISTSEFIAIDLELSGLGDRKRLSSKCLDERYTSMKDAAKTRSIISVGISLFKPEQADESDGVTDDFVIQTYNILALCSQPYIVEPEALKFLTKHGFDFNKQYSTGLPYLTDPTRRKVDEEPSLSSLFHLIGAARKPLVLHNGLVDLIFLYQNLYLDLPSKLSTFLADVEDLFPAGVYDTKYVAEYHIRTKASYLQYVFRSCLAWNSENNGRVKLNFLPLSRSNDVYTVATRRHVDNDTQIICQQYASHGWCAKAGNCPKSHDISLIVGTDRLHTKLSKNRKRRLKEKERKKRARVGDPSPHTGGGIDISDPQKDITDPADVEQTEDDSQTSCREKGELEGSSLNGSSLNGQASRTIQSCHRAGVDAFMTGLSYAVFRVQLAERKIDIKELGNKLYLSGKNVPLQVTKGNFGKLSPAHTERRSTKR